MRSRDSYLVSTIHPLLKQEECEQKNEIFIPNRIIMVVLSLFVIRLFVLFVSLLLFSENLFHNIMLFKPFNEYKPKIKTYNSGSFSKPYFIPIYTAINIPLEANF